jgi:hypothetical protein
LVIVAEPELAHEAGAVTIVGTAGDAGTAGIFTAVPEDIHAVDKS